MTSPATAHPLALKTPQDLTQAMNHAILAEAQRHNTKVQIHFIHPDGSELCTSGPVVRLSEFAVWVRDDRFDQSLHRNPPNTPEAFPSGSAYGVYLRSIQKIQVL